MKRPGKSSKAFSARGLVVLLVFAFAGHAFGQQSPGIIATVAGDGTAGYNGDNIAATGAELYHPFGAAVDSAGNLYIADTYNQRVRKMDASGIITTVAGNGTPGYNGDSIAATSAELSYPQGVGVDSAGNLYIADTDNERIRKVDTSGTITTVAGNGTAGYNGDNIAATSAELSSPTGVAVDSAGNLYLADYGNFRIRKVDASGTITTVAGNGTPGYNGDNIAATSAKLYYPFGAAVDSAGDLYIADSYNQRVRKVDASGTITTVAGNGTPGYNGDNIAATSAELTYPVGAAVDSAGNLYIADHGNFRIRKVDASGTIATVAGNGTAGYNGDNIAATSAELSNPLGLAVDTAGNLYIADYGTSRIRKVASAAELITDLVNTVNSFNLQAGIANSLDAKLQAALASLAANNVTAACNQISAFINEVMAQSGNMLTVDQANQLIAAANQIKVALGCP